jgi:hypothetical protein
VNVYDLPRLASRDAYESAVASYVAAVAPRASAVYQVGNLTYPGLSDIDLLVVPDRPRADNQYYYSASARVPRPYEPFFLHEPFVVPQTVADVMRYTTHAHRRLLAGTDVLSAQVPTDDPDAAWCRVLESYCAYASYAARTRAGRTLNGRWCIAIASAMRFFLIDFDRIFSTSYSQSYARSIDAIRATAFEGDVRDAILCAWEQFIATFDVAERNLAHHLGVDEASLCAAARGLLSGGRRRDAIARYHDELERFGFPYGHVFLVAAYDDAVRTVRPPPYARYVCRNYYRIQRRLRGHAHV